MFPILSNSHVKYTPNGEPSACGMENCRSNDLRLAPQASRSTRSALCELKCPPYISPSSLRGQLFASLRVLHFVPALRVTRFALMSKVRRPSGPM